MKIIGDLKCYHCGHVSGQLIGEAEAPITARDFRPAPSHQGWQPVPGEPLYCLRCKGPVYLDEIAPYQEPAAVEPILMRRRIRPAA